MAMELIDAAAEAGADAVKFQSFRADLVISRHASKAAYQIENTGSGESQLEMARRLELDLAAHRKMFLHCRKKGIQFLSTPFDSESLRLLVETFDLPRIKLPSGEITNAPLLLEAAATSRPIILSTGMSTLEEVKSALGVLAFGYLGGDRKPSPPSFEEAFNAEAGQETLRRNVILLHCTSAYPTPFEDVNLRVLDTLRSCFGLPVGYSDHTPGIAVSIAAAARDAVIIEKHLTLDRNLPGPDHKASLEPPELQAMISGIRQVEHCLGSPVKQPAPSETENIRVARKSLVAASPICKGERFTEFNLSVKRPGDGISPMRYWSLLGESSPCDYEPDDPILPLSPEKGNL